MGFIRTLLGLAKSKAVLTAVIILLITAVGMIFSERFTPKLIGRTKKEFGKDAIIHFLRSESSFFPKDDHPFRVYFYEADFDNDQALDLAISSPQLIEKNDYNWYLYRSDKDTRKFLDKIYFDPDMVSIKPHPEQGGALHSRSENGDICRRRSYQITSNFIKNSNGEEFKLSGPDSKIKKKTMLDIIGPPDVRNTGTLTYRDISISPHTTVATAAELKRIPLTKNFSSENAIAPHKPGPYTLIVTNPDRGEPTGFYGQYLHHTETTVDVRIPKAHVFHYYTADKSSE